MGHISIARNLHAVIGDHLRTTYHMPYVRVSFLGNPAASCGVPPNPLKTYRILTRSKLSVTPEIPRKMFLGLRRVILCA